MASDSIPFARQAVLLLLVASAAAFGVYFFFQNAPDAKLCVSPSSDHSIAVPPTRLTRRIDACDSAECEDISLSYVVNGVLPTWLNGRNDKMGTVQGLWQCASKYKEHHADFVLASFCIVYIALQAFAIPGPIVLSILSGAIYPFWEAQLLVAFCATTGASLCFLMSYCLGRGLFNRLFASMIGRFKDKVSPCRV